MHNKLFILKINNNHLFYKYDLTIRLFWLNILLMWKPTHNNQRSIEHYCSFSCYSTRTYKGIWQLHFGKVLNPKYN